VLLVVETGTLESEVERRYHPHKTSCISRIFNRFDVCLLYSSHGTPITIRRFKKLHLNRVK
jgi:hypothetical protein